MYVETIKAVVQRQIDQVTGQQGLKLQEVESLQPQGLKALASALKGWG